jgi:molybdopterin-guanine dinucleotide biosynthesis protein A
MMGVLPTANVRCAAIIAGGASRRMQQNKALLPFEGRPLITRVAGVLQSLFPEIVVVTQDAQTIAAANLPSISDIYKNKGPLGGIHAALSHFQNPVFCVACDLPFLNADAIGFLCAQLENHDAVLPQIQNRAEPLHAIYTPRCTPIFESELCKERARSVSGVLRELNVRFISENELHVFDANLKFLTNLNTPQEAHTAGLSL